MNNKFLVDLYQQHPDLPELRRGLCSARLDALQCIRSWRRDNFLLARFCLIVRLGLGFQYSRGGWLLHNWPRVGRLALINVSVNHRPQLWQKVIPESSVVRDRKYPLNRRRECERIKACIP